MEKYRDWLDKISSLRVNRTHGDPAKPLLLLVILDMAEEGKLSPILAKNRELEYRFQTYSQIVSPRRSTSPRLVYPLFYLKLQGFWEPRDINGNPAKGYDDIENVSINPSFYEQLQSLFFRYKAREILVTRYFVEDEYPALDLDRYQRKDILLFILVIIDYADEGKLNEIIDLNDEFIHKYLVFLDYYCSDKLSFLAFTFGLTSLYLADYVITLDANNNTTNQIENIKKLKLRSKYHFIINDINRSRIFRNKILKLLNDQRDIKPKHENNVKYFVYTNNILSKTLPEIYGINEKEIDLLYTYFDSLKFNSIKELNNYWENKHSQNIYSFEELSVLLSLSLGIILKYFHNYAEIILRYFIENSEIVLNRRLDVSQSYCFNIEQYFTSHDINTVKLAYPNESFLNKTLPELFNINDEEYEMLYEMFDKTTYQFIYDLNEYWQKNELLDAYYFDNLSSLLTLSIGVLFNNLKKYTDKVISYFTSETSRILRRNLSIDSSVFDRVKISNSLRDINLFHKGEEFNISNLLENNTIGLNYQTYCCLNDIYLSDDLLVLQNKLDNLPIKTYSIICYIETALRQSTNDRDIGIIMARKGLTDGIKYSLEQVGNKYGITRSRVGQIEIRVNSRIYNKNKDLMALDDILVYFIQLCGGFCSIDRLTNIINVQLKWDLNSLNKILYNYLEKIPSIVVAKESCYIENFHCLSCKTILNKADNYLDEINKDKMLLSDLSNILSLLCKLNCPKYKNRPSEIDYYLILREKEFKRSIIINNELHTSKYNNSQKSLKALLTYILLENKKPMHFKEVYTVLCDSYKGDKYKLSPNNIKGVLDRCTKTILWDRGTFYHKDYIVKNNNILANINRYLKRVFDHKVPFVTIYLIYKEFKDDCKNIGINSETALYSYLKLFNKKWYHYLKYPYISKCSQLISIQNAIDRFILHNKKTVTKKLIYQYAINSLGLKEFQINNQVNLDNYINLGDKLIPLANIRYDKLGFQGIMKRIEVSLENNKTFNAEIFYRKNHITLHDMGVINPHQLYSLIKVHFNNNYKHNRYPYITINKKSMIINAYEFVKSQNSQITYSKLYTEMECGRQLIYLLANKKDILRYTRGSLVHKDNIGLTDKIKEDLKIIALNEYENKVKQKLFCGLVYDLQSFEELPTLAGNYWWTKELLIDVLTKMCNMISVGPLRNAFIPVDNEFGIKTYDDYLNHMRKTRFYSNQGKYQLDLLLVENKISRYKDL